jgi:hypothetical protein
MYKDVALSVAYRKRSGSDEGERELINISSDDDMSKNDDDGASVQKSQNGDVTVEKGNISDPVLTKVSCNVSYVAVK